MALARFKLPTANFPVSVFHCISRVVDRRMILKTKEKDVFVDLMRRYEAFCGLRVLTFAIMSNHFHILVEVPRRPDEKDLPTDAQLVSRVRDCYGKQAADDLEQALTECLTKAAEAAEPELARGEQGAVLASAVVGWRGRHHQLRERLFARMWDVSPFMQSLKRKFSTWYNSSREEKRTGTLWEARFKSTIVMGGSAVVTVGAYIDLNPVRAGIVEDPADYRWSGYGEACAGVKLARRNLHALVELFRGASQRQGSDKAALAWYRLYIHEQGARNVVEAKTGEVKAAVFSAAEVAQVKAQQGELPAVQQMLCRVRYFSAGLVVGSKELVEQAFAASRDYFSEQRRDGARKMRHGGDWGKLRAMRDLRETSPT